jgi:hypothetical protein
MKINTLNGFFVFWGQICGKHGQNTLRISENTAIVFLVAWPPIMMKSLKVFSLIFSAVLAQKLLEFM